MSKIQNNAKSPQRGCRVGFLGCRTNVTTEEVGIL